MIRLRIAVRSRRTPILFRLSLQLQGILPVHGAQERPYTSRAVPDYARSFDSVATSLCEAATTLRMTNLDEEMVTTDKPVLARRFVVRGRVQGVGFRWFVEREAHILGIAGWVRNNADSSVEILAMGTREQLTGLRSRLREGPRAARVDDVEESEAKPISGLSTFPH